MADVLQIKTVLVSVSDRSGLIEFCRALGDVRFIATGSTGAYLNQHGIVTTTVADITGFPEMLDGRVKTMHPKIAGGILADRAKPEHLAQLEEHGIPRIDLVVVNLYPFREAVAKDAPWPEVIEQIDIGGPTMVRSAAKNHTGVGIVVNPLRYRALADEIAAEGGLTADTRRSLAAEAFSHTAAYDAAISGWMHREEIFPEQVSLAFDRVATLRYGENPHQAGALYAQDGAAPGSLAKAAQLHGKELSYNNYLDLDAALAAAFDFEEAACSIIKHAIPCGLAVGADPAEAYVRALECDRVSAFGSVVAFNRHVTADAARAMAEIFTECVVAPGYDDEALTILKEKKNLRIMDLGGDYAPDLSYRRVSGGFLVQEPDVHPDTREGMEVVTKAEPTPEQWNDLLFAWRACKHVRSNAIVLAREGATVGIGGGQVSRVDAAEIAARKAGDRAKGSVMASDAFFPFRDGLDAGAVAGVAAVIQPGGSMRDDEVIAAANEHGIPMVLTGVRHFRHG